MVKVFPETLTESKNRAIRLNNMKLKKQGKLIDYFLVSGILIFLFRLVHLFVINYAVLSITEKDFNNRELVIQKLLLASSGVKSTFYNYLAFFIFFVVIPIGFKNFKLFSPVSVYFFIDNKPIIFIYTILTIVTYLANYKLDSNTADTVNLIFGDTKFKYYELSIKQLKLLMYMKLFLIFVHIPVQAIVLFRVYKSFMNIKL
tara:strand:+ start:114 stop:719 length:606 start_codon:yes stop_codon:yes gene_type:complete